MMPQPAQTRVNGHCFTADCGGARKSYNSLGRRCLKEIDAQNDTRSRLDPAASGRSIPIKTNRDDPTAKYAK